MYYFLFLIYYFKKHFKSCLFILKALKDILQHFKFVNWWIHGFGFFSITNRLYLEFWLNYILQNWIGVENSSSKWFQYTSTVIYNRELCHKIWSKGPFNNYVDQIYPILAPSSPPPSSSNTYFFVYMTKRGLYTDHLPTPSN